MKCNFVASGGDGDGAAERLVGSPPGPPSTDIIRERRDAARMMLSSGNVGDNDGKTLRMTMMMGGSERTNSL